MITLALASAFFYLTLQNWPIFNGFNGFTTIPAPHFLGINWKAPIPLYYLILFFAALSYAAVLYLSRAPFGLALQGVRDNPRRMEAIGYNVTAHRIAAYAFAALIAAVGGILMVWLNNQISPFSVGIDVVINILVIAVVGGLSHPIGPFIGALIYVILRTFALDALVAVGLDGRRFQTLIGFGFLVIVSVLAGRGHRHLAAIVGTARAPAREERRAEHDRRTFSRGRHRQRDRAAGREPFLRRARRLDRHYAQCAARRAARRAGIERRRQDDAAQLRDRRLSSDLGNGALLRRGRHPLPPHERIRRGLRRTYQISLLFQDLSVRDNVYLACRGCSRGRFSFIRTRATDAIMQSVADLISARPSGSSSRSSGRRTGARPAAAARDRARARRRAALYSVRRAGGGPLAE